MKKNLVIASLIIIIVASIITNIYILSNKEEDTEFKIDGIDTVENKEILKDTTINELDITNASLLTRDSISSYSAEVTNNTDSTINIDKLYIVFYENEKEDKVLALSDIKLKPGDKTNINITSESDLSKTTEIKYTTE